MIILSSRVSVGIFSSVCVVNVYPFFFGVDEKVKESERKSCDTIVQGFYTRKFCIFFFPEKFVFCFCFRWVFFFQYDIIDSLAFLCVIITNSPLFNVSHRAKKNIIGSQKQHFHLPPLFFSFYFFLLRANFYFFSLLLL